MSRCITGTLAPLLGKWHNTPWGSVVLGEDLSGRRQSPARPPRVLAGDAQAVVAACPPLFSNLRACSFLGILTCSVLLHIALVFPRLASAQSRSSVDTFLCEL